MCPKTTKYMNSTVCGITLLLLGGTVSLHQFKVPLNMGDIAALFNISAENATWFMSIFTVIGVFLALPAGSLVAKIGAKNTVMLAGLFAALGSFLGAFSTNGSIMLASRAIEGIGFAMVAVAGPSTIVSTVAPNKVPGAVGIWACWVPLGNIVAYNLTPILYDNFSGFKVPWIAYAFLSFIMVFLVKVSVKAPQPIAKNDTAPPRSTLVDLLKKKNFMLAVLAFTCYNYLLMAWITFVPAYAIENDFMSPAVAGFVASIPMFICFVSSPFFGNWAGKIGFKKISIGTLLVTGLGFILGFLPSTLSIYVAAVCIGIGQGNPGMIYGAASTLVDGEAGLIGLSNGMIIVLQNLGMFLGTATFLSVVAMTGGSFTAAAMIAIPITLVGAVLSAMAKYK